MRVYFLWNFSQQGWIWFDLKRSEWRLRPCPYRATQFSDFEEMIVAKKAFPDDYLIEVPAEVEVDWRKVIGWLGGSTHVGVWGRMYDGVVKLRTRISKFFSRSC